MIQKIHDGFYGSTFFPIKTGIIHGFTSKKHGSMQEKTNRIAAIASAGLDPNGLVWANQSHGSTIHVVRQQDCGAVIDDVDGFIYKHDVSWNMQPVVAVHVGDCAPLLFFDPVNEVIGAVHAGWKGTKAHIASAMMRKFLQLGSTVQNVRVAIGPYIQSCCYTVDEDRAMMFEREYPGGRGIVNKAGDQWYVDIGLANSYDLRQSGVLEKHIDRNSKLCTHCNCNEFYSYRRTTEDFGEIMGYIGYHNI